MEEQYTIVLPQEKFLDLLDILADLYTTSPEARNLLRIISTQTNEHTEVVAELDHDFKEEVNDK